MIKIKNLNEIYKLSLEQAEGLRYENFEMKEITLEEFQKFLDYSDYSDEEETHAAEIQELVLSEILSDSFAPTKFHCFVTDSDDVIELIENFEEENGIKFNHSHDEIKWDLLDSSTEEYDNNRFLSHEDAEDILNGYKEASQKIDANNEAYDAAISKPWKLEICGRKVVLEADIGDIHHRTFYSSELFEHTDESYEIRIKDHSFSDGAGSAYGFTAPDFELVLEDACYEDDPQSDYENQIYFFLAEVSEEITELLEAQITENA